MLSEREIWSLKTHDDVVCKWYWTMMCVCGWLLCELYIKSLNEDSFRCATVQLNLITIWFNFTILITYIFYFSYRMDIYTLYNNSALIFLNFYWFVYSQYPFIQNILRLTISMIQKLHHLISMFIQIWMYIFIWHRNVMPSSNF